MAVIQRLKIDAFRNLAGVDLTPSEHFNLITGVNGSGKTSLLEAIHVLSVGKSFRTQRTDSLVNVDESEFIIFSELLPGRHAVGVQKSRHGKTALRIDQQPQRNWQEVAALLPLQVINSDSFALLDGGARHRRRFLDWAVFHVEHSYLSAWRGYQRSLAQRNALLKAPATAANISQLEPWEAELARCGEIVHAKRKELIEKFTPVFQDTLSALVPTLSPEIKYRAGWDADASDSLLDTLTSGRDKDFRYGSTQHGPHRADFVLTDKGRSVTELYSRGQLKMLVCAIKLAVGALFQAQYAAIGRDYNCVYLIDDLASELDQRNRGLVVAALAETGSQCFFTAIEGTDLADVSGRIYAPSGKFHVEHGKIQVVQ